MNKCVVLPAHNGILYSSQDEHAAAALIKGMTVGNIIWDKNAKRLYTTENPLLKLKD